MIALLLVESALAGAWTRPLGGTYAKLGIDGYASPEYVSPVALAPGAVDTGITGFWSVQASVYVETGFLEPEAWRAQLALSVPVGLAQTGFAFESAFGDARGYAQVVRAGDVRLTPQVALHRTAPVALALEIKVPAYRNDSICAGNPYRVYCPRPGEGQVDLTPSALAGVANGAFFGEFLAGWRFRTDWVLGAEGPLVPLGDGPVWSVAGGWNAGRVLFIGRFEGNHVFGEDFTTPQAIRTGPSAIWTFAEKSGLALEGRFSADLFAKGTAAGAGGGIGLSARR